MPDTHDYPLAEVLGSGDLIHQARPAALFGSRIETRCGMEGNKTGRDGGAWCPECVALEQAEVDVDDKSGSFRNDLRTQLVAAGTEAAEQWLAVRANRKMSDVNRRRLAGHVVNALWTEIEHAALEMAQYVGDEQLTAATARAEKAEAALAHANSVVDAFHVEADRMSDRYDNLRNDYDRLRAQVAGLDEPTEWGQPRTEWTWSARKPDGAAVPLMYPDPHPPRTEESVRREFDGVVDNMGYRKVLLCREVTAWRDANGGWSSRRPDASLDGLRGPFTGLLGPLGIGADTAPDGQAEDAVLPVADCPSPYRDGTCRHLTCGRCNEHTNNSSQGHYWAYCKVTKTKREHHFCCPGDCELEPPNIRHDDTNGAKQ